MRVSLLWWRTRAAYFTSIAFAFELVFLFFWIHVLTMPILVKHSNLSVLFPDCFISSVWMQIASPSMERLHYKECRPKEEGLHCTLEKVILANTVHKDSKQKSSRCRLQVLYKGDKMRNITALVRKIVTPADVHCLLALSCCHPTMTF